MLRFEFSELPQQPLPFSPQNSDACPRLRPHLTAIQPSAVMNAVEVMDFELCRIERRQIG